MTHDLVIHGFETSNNMKVRIALGFKDIAYEFRRIDPVDRSEILAISGQHLTPVMTHGDRVLFDSAAILRYLDANFEGPRLFGSSRDEQWEIEDWEMFARTRLAGPMMEVVHSRIAGHPVEPTRMATLNREFFAAIEALFARLSNRNWLVTDGMTAADITAAAVVHRIAAASMFVPSESAGQADPFAPCAAWRASVMRHDAHLEGPAS